MDFGVARQIVRKAHRGPFTLPLSHQRADGLFRYICATRRSHPKNRGCERNGPRYLYHLYVSPYRCTDGLNRVITFRNRAKTLDAISFSLRE